MSNFNIFDTRGSASSLTTPTAKAVGFSGQLNHLKRVR